MENNKQTALQFFLTGLVDLEIGKNVPTDKVRQLHDLFNEAKQIEKKQIVEAARWEPFLGEMSKEVGEQYYDEKYGNSREVAQ